MTHDRLLEYTDIKCAWGSLCPDSSPLLLLLLPQCLILHYDFTTFQSQRILCCLDVAYVNSTFSVDGLDNAFNIFGEFLFAHLALKIIIIILLMENLPPINEMYACMQQQRDYDVIRKYQHTRVQGETRKSPTKKGSYLDDAIKMSNSPGPANQSNIQISWTKPNKQLVKYSDRKTYVDQIQASSKKRNSPSPNHYSLSMPWPDKAMKPPLASQKINFLDHSEYQSIQTPGPGTYIVATNIAKKVKEYHHNETKPLQVKKQSMADMNTYDPIPVDYATFKKYQKLSKNKSIVKKQEKQTKKGRQNLSPGPGHYQMINSWQGKQKKLPEGSLTYLAKISKGPTPNVYYH